MNSAIWKVYKDEKTYKFQVHGKEHINKVKRQKGWSQVAYGWDPKGKDVVIFMKSFRHPSGCKKKKQKILHQMLNI